MYNKFHILQFQSTFRNAKRYRVNDLTHFHYEYFWWEIIFSRLSQLCKIEFNIHKAFMKMFFGINVRSQTHIRKLKLILWILLCSLLTLAKVTVKKFSQWMNECGGKLLAYFDCHLLLLMMVEKCRMKSRELWELKEQMMLLEMKWLNCTMAFFSC